MQSRPSKSGGGGAGASANPAIRGNARSSFLTFYSGDGNEDLVGCSVSPNAVLIFSAIFIVLVLVLHIFGKFVL